LLGEFNFKVKWDILKPSIEELLGDTEVAEELTLLLDDNPRACKRRLGELLRSKVGGTPTLVRKMLGNLRREWFDEYEEVVQRETPTRITLTTTKSSLR